MLSSSSSKSINTSNKGYWTGKATFMKVLNLVWGCPQEFLWQGAINRGNNSNHNYFNNMAVPQRKVHSKAKEREQSF